MDVPHSLRDLRFHSRHRFKQFTTLLGIALSSIVVGAILPLVINFTANRIAVGMGSTVEVGRDHQQEGVAILTVIAGIMTTAIAVLYSALFVLQNLASTQFSPRLLHATARYRVLQYCTGCCLGTLTYCLVMLGVLSSTVQAGQQVGVYFGMLLAISSILIFMFAVAYTSQNFQINYILDRVAKETEQVIQSKMTTIDEKMTRECSSGNTSPLSQEYEKRFRRKDSGYLQDIHLDELKRLAASENIAVDIKVAVGEFVTRDVPLIYVYGKPAIDTFLEDKLLDSFHLGPIPTIEQDPEYGMRLLVDVALKAISPAVNDPSTAVTCLDHLEKLLIAASRRRDETEYPGIKNGAWTVRHKPITFRRLLSRACRQLRHYGATDYAICVRMMRLLEEVAAEARCVRYLEYIEEEAKYLYDSVLAETGRFSRLDMSEIHRRYLSVGEVITHKLKDYYTVAGRYSLLFEMSRNSKNPHFFFRLWHFLSRFL